MRIISGKFKKQKLVLPDPKITRPLRDYVKESLFNLLVHSPLLQFQFEKSSILDIFSGSGSFGIECLSRGASHVTFVENNKKSFEVLKNNIQNFSILNEGNLIFGDFLKIQLDFSLTKPNLIFLDPPFQFKLLGQIFEKLSENKKNLSDSIVMIHHEEGEKFNFSNYLDEILKKKYGRSIVLFGKIKN
jgi:16S rRNA (guanine966-N2)-methyltransferase